jgi:3-oxoacyl-(acyl-carrier-protein) synthase
MERRVVITGIGVVAPQAPNAGEFWDRLKNNVGTIEAIYKCDTRLLKVKYAGQVNNGQLQPEQYFNARYLKKCDDFSVYALLAVREALTDAALDIGRIGPERIGIYVGNNSGGWHAAEKGLKDLHDQGTAYISPFLASNWFPAAPQGHISIYYQMMGYSKTVAADMASAAIAIGNAYKLVKNGTCDFMVAGGTENLVVAWGLLFYQTSAILGFRVKWSAEAYTTVQANRGSSPWKGPLYTETWHRPGNNAYMGNLGFGLTNDGYRPGCRLSEASMPTVLMAVKKSPGYSLNGCVKNDYAR